MVNRIRSEIKIHRRAKIEYCYLVSVTTGGQVSPRGQILPSSTAEFG